MGSAFLAITRQTIRTSVRQRVFHLLLVFVLLVVVVLPLVVTGDGTAMAQVQITLTYTMGLITALISAATLWLACASISREVEGYQMHLVLTSPVPHWLVWLGKWFGVFVLQAALLLIGAGVAAGMLYWGMAHWRFPAEEQARVRDEVMVGRHEYLPEQPDFVRLAQEEYQRRLAAGSLAPDHNPMAVRSELLRQVKARSTEIPNGITRLWTIRGIHVPGPQAKLYLRYRNYVGTTSKSEQKFTEGLWVFHDPKGGADAFQVLPMRAVGGAFHEVVVPTGFLAADGSITFGYDNQDQGGTSVIFQATDGPTILVPETGFLANYARALLLALFQIGFLAALGCTVSALFSSPVALFVAIAYLGIGFTVQSAVQARTADEFGEFRYTSLLDRGAHVVALVTSKVVVAVDEFDASQDIIHGRLITGPRILRTAGLLIGLQTLPMALFGIWIFSRRELGLVIRG